MKIVKDILDQHRKQWRIESHTEPGLYYTVFYVSGKYKCTCPALSKYECRHIKQIKKNETNK